MGLHRLCERPRTAVPAISECLWRDFFSTDFSAAPLPQSPRFQSACGGNASWSDW